MKGLEGAETLVSLAKIQTPEFREPAGAVEVTFRVPVLATPQVTQQVTPQVGTKLGPCLSGCPIQL